MKKYLIDSVFSVSLLILLSAETAYAYLDPGTGSYIIQVSIAMVFGVLFAIKIFWTNVKLFFLNLFKRKDRQE
jgi:hypothetical protein